MNKRILELRKKLNLTQTQFGEKIGLKASAILAYEKGYRVVTERSIADICRVYNVSEEWLRTGRGLMFNPPQSTNTELAGEIGKLLRSDDEFTKTLFIRYLKLPPEFKAQFKDFLQNLAENLPPKEENK